MVKLQQVFSEQSLRGTFLYGIAMAVLTVYTTANIFADGAPIYINFAVQVHSLYLRVQLLVRHVVAFPGLLYVL